MVSCLRRVFLLFSLRRVRTWVVGIVVALTISVPHIVYSDKISQMLSDVLVEMGISVKEILVYGDHMVNPEDVVRVVDRKKSIIMLPLKKLGNLVKLQNPWIKEVAINRVLYSGTLNIRIYEHEAFANWCHHGVNSIIDDTGYVIVNSEERFDNLVSIYGDDAIEDMGFIRNILKTGEVLSTMVSSLSLIDGKRWDVNFSSGLRVKLPEFDPMYAWEGLVQMHNEYHDLLMWGEIDMRSDKVIIRR